VITELVVNLLFLATISTILVDTLPLRLRLPDGRPTLFTAFDFKAGRPRFTSSLYFFFLLYDLQDLMLLIPEHQVMESQLFCREFPVAEDSNA
jgi:hypothetical protein